MIKLEHLTRRYGESTVIKDLSFTFPDKGVFALMGPSGCGKTTLLRLLAGLDLPDGGTITSTHERTAVAFQEPRLLPWLNCEENIKCVLPKGKERSGIAKKYLEMLELGDEATAFPDQLSGGMKQRLSLARALAYEGDLLLLDEPFSALDTALKERIAPLLIKAGEQHLVVLVTHDEKEAVMLGATVLRCSGSPITSLDETAK